MKFKIAFAVFFFAVLVVSGYALFIPQTNKDEVVAPVEGNPEPAPIVTLDATYRRGVHTISGTIEAPTPCTLVGVESAVASSTPASITVSLTLTPDEDICVQVVTPLPFSVTAAAPEDAVIAVTVQGKPVEPLVKES